MTLTVPRHALADPDESTMGEPAPTTPEDARRAGRTEPEREWLRELTWELFEALLETAFIRDGFTVSTAPDQLAERADLVLQRAGGSYLVVCTHWKAQQVGISAVDELADLVAGQNIDGGLLVTAGTFSADALTRADETGLVLLDGDDLVRMAAGSPLLPLADETRSQWTLPKDWTAFGAPTCPLCEQPMLYKRVRAGAHAGMRFWGCRNYPSCRAIREVASSAAALPLERPAPAEVATPVAQPTGLPTPPVVGVTTAPAAAAPRDADLEAEPVETIGTESMGAEPVDEPRIEAVLPTPPVLTPAPVMPWPAPPVAESIAAVLPLPSAPALTPTPVAPLPAPPVLEQTPLPAAPVLEQTLLEKPAPELLAPEQPAPELLAPEQPALEQPAPERAMLEQSAPPSAVPQQSELGQPTTAEPPVALPSSVTAPISEPSVSLSQPLSTFDAFGAHADTIAPEPVVVGLSSVPVREPVWGQPAPEAVVTPQAAVSAPPAALAPLANQPIAESPAAPMPSVVVDELPAAAPPQGVVPVAAPWPQAPMSQVTPELPASHDRSALAWEAPSAAAVEPRQPDPDPVWAQGLSERSEDDSYTVLLAHPTWADPRDEDEDVPSFVPEEHTPYQWPASADLLDEPEPLTWPDDDLEPATQVEVLEEPAAPARRRQLMMVGAVLAIAAALTVGIAVLIPAVMSAMKLMLH